MEYKLSEPFDYEGQKIEKCTIKKTQVKVIDRIKAKTEAKSVFGTEEGDAFMLCLINRLCDFGVSIPSLELAEKLSSEDLDNIAMKIMGIDEDFLQYLAKNSEASQKS